MFSLLPLTIKNYTKLHKTSERVYKTSTFGLFGLINLIYTGYLDNLRLY